MCIQFNRKNKYPAGIYMFKANNRKTIEQGVKYVQS